MTKQQEQLEPTSTVDRLQTARLKQRQEAAERYRVLLLRNDNPKANDAEDLVAVMQVLGRQLDDLPHDIGLVRALAAADDAAQEARKVDGPWEQAKQALKQTKERLADERAAFKKRAAAELQAAESAFQKLSAERHSLQVASEQAPADEWRALLDGISIEEARAARRAARRPTVATPQASTREQVIADARHEMVVLECAPAVGSACDYVNKGLAAQGLSALTDDEIQKHGIEGWTARPKSGARA